MIITLAVFYRCMNALLPNDFCHMFIKNADLHLYETRIRDTVHMTTCRMNLRKHGVRFFGPTVWNCLLLNIRNVHTVHSFKRHYKSILIDNIVHLCFSYLYYSLEFSFVCTFFSDQLLVITSGDIIFQVVS